MHEQYPLTVFFDASCGLCNSEMQAIKIQDTEQHLIFVDCSAASFDDASYRAESVTRKAMMECLHVRDNRGVWIKGVPAFELLYRTIGMPVMAICWGGGLTRPLMEHLYPWIARNRLALSRTGLPVLFDVWGKLAARRANKRSRRCSEGQCSI